MHHKAQSKACDAGWYGITLRSSKSTLSNTGDVTTVRSALICVSRGSALNEGKEERWLTHHFIKLLFLEQSVRLLLHISSSLSLWNDCNSRMRAGMCCDVPFTPLFDQQLLRSSIPNRQNTPKWFWILLCIMFHLYAPQGNIGAALGRWRELQTEKISILMQRAS